MSWRSIYQVMELSENLKLRLDSPAGDAPSERVTLSQEAGGGVLPGASETNPIDDAESQMRKALGLLGEPQRHRPDGDRMDQSGRAGDRFGGGLHRRRFVQDGDIPVTVLRRDQGHEAPAHRGVPTPPPPTSSRLQRTEAALAAETGAREKAERLLAESHSVVRDLQTKIGHAELARNEAQEALRQERETIAQLRMQCETFEERVQAALEQARAAERNTESLQEQLAEERHARKTAEKALRAAEVAKETAEQLVQTLSQVAPPVSEAAPVREAPSARPVSQQRRPRIAAEPQPTARRAKPQEVAETEPEPVKWWLNTKPAGKKR